MSEPVRVLSWNLERVPPNRREALQRRLDATEHDVSVLTETSMPSVPTPTLRATCV